MNIFTEQHIINQFIIELDGSTKEKSLKKEMALTEGQSFPSLEELKKAVDRQKQDLLNLRVFNSVDMEAVLLEADGEIYLYDVVIKTEDTWTFIPFPYPKYDSNTGFRVGMKFFYDNAFGSLTNLYLGTNLDISREEGDLKTGNWTINPQWNHVKIGEKYFGFSFTQQYREISKQDGEIYLEDYGVYTTSLGAKTHFDITQDYFYSIGTSLGANYGYTGFGYEGNKEPFYISFGHSGGFGRVDWIQNFREGYSLSAGNNISSILSLSGNSKMEIDVDIDSRYYKILSSRLNYSNRMYGILNFNDEIAGLGAKVRGVKNNAMYGVAGFFVSNDINISVIQWEGKGEAQFQPFFDLGMVRREEYSFNPKKDIRYGTGADFILYLDAMKGLHARASVGIDLSRYSWDDMNKYALIITSSLAY